MGVVKSVVEGIVDSVPVVGHIKAVVHYASDDTTKGDQALKRANRTTLVVGVGVGIVATGGLAGVALAPATLGGVGAAVAGEAYDGYHGESKIMSAIDGVMTGAKEMKNGNILNGLKTGVSSVGMAGLGFAGDFATGSFGARAGHKFVPGKELANIVKPSDIDSGDRQEFGEPRGLNIVESASTTDNLGVLQDINRVATKSTQLQPLASGVMFAAIANEERKKGSENCNK